MSGKIETRADADVCACIDQHRSFALVAGAGSGKTTSLIDALARVRAREGTELRQNGQRIACITFTKRAVEVIKVQLGFDELYLVSTLHSFLWGQISSFHDDMRKALREARIPALIQKERAKDNGGNSRAATDARAKALRYELDLAELDTARRFTYDDAMWGDYPAGRLGHDDIIEIAAYLFEHNETFRRITGLRFPYIFVDEAQDTFPGIVAGLNLVCGGEGLPIVGYFGDPWQQIYDGSAGAFTPPSGGSSITKTENFRCSKSVIRLLNAFRTDVEQYAAGENKLREGSVFFRLVQAEEPELPRSRYSEEQVTRALNRMDTALADWGWAERDDVIKLFLANQMIARRMGFSQLNGLFNGPYASTRAEEAFEAGEHFLMRPLTAIIYPLVAAYAADDSRAIVDVLRRNSPAFSANGVNADNTLKAMVDTSLSLVEQINTLWASGSIGELLRFCAAKQIIPVSDRLSEQLSRAPRGESYVEELHFLDKGDWLADALFAMKPNEIAAYASFAAKNTAYSTQHGVKGEQYSKVLVVYDDVEAAWSLYNFARTLTPATAGEPTEKQRGRGQRLAYVSFSRAVEDLRVLFFIANPDAARQELIDRKLVTAEQIEVVSA
jgi:DNA helicase II / ATP-dependent DNA helicase PcrA